MEIIKTQENKLTKEQEKEKRSEIIEFLKLSGWTQNAKQEEIELFIKYSITANLNPLKREIYFVPFNGKYQPITGFQVYISRAFKSGKLDYYQPRLEKTENGKLKCVVEVKRKDSSKAMEFTAYWDEVAKNSPIWKQQGKYMFEKVAIVQALRKAIPDDDELASLPYSQEELGYQIQDNEPVIQRQEEIEPLEIKTQEIEQVKEKVVQLQKQIEEDKQQEEIEDIFKDIKF